MSVFQNCTAWQYLPIWAHSYLTSPRDSAHHSSWPALHQVTASAPSHEVITPCFSVSVIASHEATPSTFSSASVSVTYLLPKDHNNCVCVSVHLILLHCRSLVDSALKCITFSCLEEVLYIKVLTRDIHFSSGYELIMLFQWHYLWCWLMHTKRAKFS